jgi:hypothetical protein
VVPISTSRVRDSGAVRDSNPASNSNPATARRNGNSHRVRNSHPRRLKVSLAEKTTIPAQVHPTARSGYQYYAQVNQI